MAWVSPASSVVGLDQPELTPVEASALGSNSYICVSFFSEAGSSSIY